MKYIRQSTPRMRRRIVTGLKMLLRGPRRAAAEDAQTHGSRHRIRGVKERAMTSPSKSLVSVFLVAACLAAALAPRLHSAATSCDPDNGGITLPAGFCAVVAADGLGTARHIAVAPSGDVYVAHPESVQRYKMTAGQLTPSGEPETIVGGLPPDRQHGDKGLAFD